MSSATEKKNSLLRKDLDYSPQKDLNPKLIATDFNWPILRECKTIKSLKVQRTRKKPPSLVIPMNMDGHSAERYSREILPPFLNMITFKFQSVPKYEIIF